MMASLIFNFFWNIYFWEFFSGQTPPPWWKCFVKVGKLFWQEGKLFWGLSYPVWSHEGSTLKKNRRFPRPAESDPYVYIHPCFHPIVMQMSIGINPLLHLDIYSYQIWTTNIIRDSVISQSNFVSSENKNVENREQGSVAQKTEEINQNYHYLFPSPLACHSTFILRLPPWEKACLHW